jgi:serine/threonine protein kinase
MGPQTGTQWSPPPRFDGFELRGLIGQGGMGQVYLAHEDMLDRPVAIKFILNEHANGSARERFLTEGRGADDRRGGARPPSLGRRHPQGLAQRSRLHRPRHEPRNANSDSGSTSCSTAGLAGVKSAIA